MYKKDGLPRSARFHIDMFVDVNQIEMDEQVIFERNRGFVV